VVSKFSDARGDEWTIAFDCFLLDRVRKEAEVDLADVSAGGLLSVERDVTALGRVVAVACDEQWKARGRTAREFSRGIRGEALTRARGAVMEALADFFPASEWSAMQSSLRNRKNKPNVTPEELQLAAGFLRMDPEVQRDVMHLIQQEMTSGNSQSLPDAPYASSPDAMPQSPVVDSPVSAK